MVEAILVELVAVRKWPHNFLKCYKIPSPRPSPRLGGERESSQIVSLPSGIILGLSSFLVAMELI
jgi:hypothetical protein